MLLPAPNPPSQHVPLPFRMLTLPEAGEMNPIRTRVSCFPSQRYPQIFTGTYPLILKNKVTHIMVKGKRSLPHSHVCSDTVRVATLASLFQNKERGLWRHAPLVLISPPHTQVLGRDKSGACTCLCSRKRQVKR